MIYYLIIIGIMSAVIFIADKQKAQKKRRRTSEQTLHILEFAGGVFVILPLMYVVRHKNRKAKYYRITYTALVFWLAILIIFYVW